MTKSKRHGRTRTLLILAGIAVAVVLAIIARNPKGRNSGGDRAENELLERLRVAIGHLENIELDEAETGLRALKETFPDSASLQQNLAVTTALRVRTIREKIKNANLEPDEIKAARRQFTPAANKSRGDIRSLQAMSPDDVVTSFLSTKVALAQASLLPGAIRRDDERQVADKLLQTLTEHPDWVILIGPLLHLLETSDSDDLAERVLPVLRAVSDTRQRNLFIALEAMLLAVSIRDSSAEELIQRVKTLGEPLVSHAAPISKPLGLTPAELADQAIKAASGGDWDQAATSAGFLSNCYKGSAAFRSDLRLVFPHELDLLSMDLVAELSSQEDAAAASDLANVRFRVDGFPDKSLLKGSVDAVAIFDHDLDGSGDVIAIVDNELTVVSHQSENWVVTARTPAREGCSQLIVADLFVVDSSSRSRFKSSKEGDPNARNTYPSFIACGKSGVQIWQANPEAESALDRIVSPEKPSGLEAVKNVTASTVADIDADGDLDLILGTQNDGLQIWINRGDMTFFAVEEHSQLPPKSSPAVDFAIGDFDRDLDVDVLAVLQDGSVGLLENLLHLQYRWKPLEIKAPAGGDCSIAMADVDGNVSWDAIVSASEGLQCQLTRTTDIGNTIPTKVITGAMPRGPFVVGEWNNDPWTDLVFHADKSLTFATIGPGQTIREIGSLPVEDAVRCIAAGDLDDDPLMDVVIGTKQGVLIAKNLTQNAGTHLDVQYKGIDDNATGKVNHYAIGSVAELNFGSYYRAQIISGQNTRFGMGKHKEAITLRAILTNGVTQNVIKPSANQLIVEEQTLKGSCPYLYAWDGEKFVFVTDCLWAAPLGLQVAPGRVVPDRPWEYLKVDGRFLKPRDGSYELRITEELWEIAYIDHLQLTAVDHPADVDIFTNEKVGPPSIAEHRIYTFDEKHLRPISKATDKFGTDVTNQLLTVDDDYVKGHRERYRQGLCEPHWIELQLDDVSSAEEVLLVLTGWIFPTDTSLNIQIAQNPELSGVVHPVMEIPDGAGGWKEVVGYMGFPGGKPKTIVVDITGKLNFEDTRIRIRTSAEIYWDRAAVAVNQPQRETRQHPLNLTAAELCFHGFSAQLPRTNTQPHRYDYSQVSLTPKWPPLAGSLSAFGNVLPELTSWDDDMVVMSGGDEIRLKFDVPTEPVPAGWKRDFVLHCVGWDKDADLNTLAGQSVGPLPFRAMKSYPPPVTQLHEIDGVERTNKGQMTRRQSFREFWSGRSKPIQ